MKLKESTVESPSNNIHSVTLVHLKNELALSVAKMRHDFSNNPIEDNNCFVERNRIDIL